MTKFNQSTYDQATASVCTLTDNANYQSDPLSVYQLLCHDKKNNLLLESAEIDQKHLLKSLLLVDAALKIVCNDNVVTFTALTHNGQTALQFAAAQLQNHAKLTLCEKNQILTATFPDTPTELDEQSRLMAINPFESLRLFNRIENSDNHHFAIFLGGAFAFDMISMSETLPKVPDGENTCPDFVYYLAETVVVIDHEKRSTEIIANLFSSSSEENSMQADPTESAERIAHIKQLLSKNITTESILPLIERNDSNFNDAQVVSVDISDEQFCKNVETLKENIRAGDIFQVVPSRTFSLPCLDSIAAYQALKLSNPSPYMFYLKDSDFSMFGASPESAIKYQQNSPEGKRQVEIYPIAGTRPRGLNADGSISLDLDSRIELELRQDKKESAEHIMLVDLARNDIARVCKAGTRYVADLLKVDRYSHVMHLVSRVCGTLLEELDALHAYQACMNMGTLSGAPKVKATSLIREIEGKRRGSYGGAVGYLTGEGEMDTCIVIRSAFVKNNIAHVQAGAGVVYDSIPQAEADETKQKAQAVINAVLTSNESLAQGVN
ncbi:anthranilate synthase component 1 [Colwellia sp. 4_MG-2023]|jgi:anthranilate synthase component 1|uniref:anthranilate synthase component 1 n=1 Tax=unclassified Colwellia TaxID=196834 RepID=UPI001C095439|nr:MULTISPECIES: anthranilate synthase component 1 [unclassified Colwellia]MBU2923993.1 anthranilate synthase component 1 [Colwellia sp. C2M11]MDO6488719.1 anthranilate synthase component 1 [Colwellia sp. 6_MG-2023]MDO6507905.1 anthranilate synthase component 1 [Colwellia sp. 5_MG-2023]MDO6556542.1 anthranilate synthase component 1 [Colwellia sp. 4_MG-2023]MDO6653638.1 anthranilate synthase component 1 [Colwellia sp. 3_MG-2023]